MRRSARRILATIFAAWTSLEGAAASRPAPFVVTSYNVENWLTTARMVDGRKTDEPKPEAEKNAVVAVVSELRPDILGVIEMGSREDLADLQRRLHGAGLDYPHSEWVDAHDKARHLALLSRFPIVERHSQSSIPFDLDGTLQYFQRGILDITVEPQPGYRLRLLGVHLKSRREVEDFDEAALRAKEAWHLRRYVDQILKADSEANILLYGDFNDTKNTYPIRQIMGEAGTPAYLSDLFIADSLGDRWTHFWKAADSYSRVDFFFASRGLLPEIEKSRSGVNRSPLWFKASDHRAIYTAISPKDR